MYTIALTCRTDTKASGTVTGGTHPYGVTLTAAGGFCECPAFSYRRRPCKHLDMFEHYLRDNLFAPVQSEPLHVGEHVSLIGHPSIQGTIVCISGDTISVAWGQGGIRPLLAKSVERLTTPHFGNLQKESTHGQL